MFSFARKAENNLTDFYEKSQDFPNKGMWFKGVPKEHWKVALYVLFQMKSMHKLEMSSLYLKNQNTSSQEKDKKMKVTSKLYVFQFQVLNV